MNHASLELSRELYEVSGWDNTYLSHVDETDIDIGWVVIRTTEDSAMLRDSTPAYDLGYLLRKLQEGSDFYSLRRSTVDGSWLVKTQYGEEVRADTPEDAVAELAIELWKQGVIA